MSIKGRIREELESSRAPIWAIVLAVLVGLPSLASKEFFDDHYRRSAMAEGQPGWDLFELLPAGSVPQLREQGVLGWWTSDELSWHFMRPLGSLSHALDLRLWPDAVWLMHAENLLIYALMAWLVARLVQRVHGPGIVAGVAGLAFALDENHAASVWWISGRNTMLAALFGLLAVLAHLRWRAPDPGQAARPWPWAALALASMAASLLSAEAGLCAFGYLLSWSLCMERGRWARRLAPLLPYVALIVAWRLVYVAQDFGAVGSSAYLDIDRHPLEFLVRALGFSPASAFAQLGPPVADAVTLQPLTAIPLGLCFIPLVWAFAPLLDADDCEGRRFSGRGWFWLLGMLFAGVPLGATYPQSRLLFALGLGGAALVGLAFEARRDGRLEGLGRRLLLGLVLVCNLLLAPLLVVPFGSLMSFMHTTTQRLIDGISDDGEVCVLLNVPAEGSPMFVAATRRNLGRDNPDHLYYLYAGEDTLEVVRTGSARLELRVDEGWAADRVNQITRDWREGFAVGDRVELEHAVVTVLEVNEDDRPTRIEVELDRDLAEVELLGLGRDETGPGALERWRPTVGESARFTTALGS